jgi:hypothetical protein
VAAGHTQQTELRGGEIVVMEGKEMSFYPQPGGERQAEAVLIYVNFI